MPYKDNGPWFTRFRAFMKERDDYLDPETCRNYRVCLRSAGTALQWKDPLNVTLVEMKGLEVRLPGEESTRAHACTVTRMFLLWCDNKAAKKWKIGPKLRAKSDGVFFSEPQVSLVRAEARAMGILEELVFSLGADNGLRCVDMLNLTLAQGRKLLMTLSEEIVGKGRARGKKGHLELSKMTLRPLQEYLKWRDAEVARLGMDHPQLLVRTTRKKLVPFQYKGIARRMIVLSQRAGLYFRLHDLRRTYGHRLHMIGKPIETIATLMRHETINQSFRSYIGIMRDEQRSAQDALGVP
jgi:integrase